MPDTIMEVVAKMTTTANKLDQFHETYKQESTESLQRIEKSKSHLKALLQSFDQGLSGRMKKLPDLKQAQRVEWCDELVITINTYMQKCRNLDTRETNVQAIVSMLHEALGLIREKVEALKKNTQDKTRLQHLMQQAKLWPRLKDQAEQTLKSRTADMKSEQADILRVGKVLKDLAPHMSTTVLTQFKQVETLKDVSERQKQAKKQLTNAKQLLAKLEALCKVTTVHHHGYAIKLKALAMKLVSILERMAK